MTKAPRQRIDQLLCDRGLVESREKARALILAGSVMANGQRVDKAGTPVPHDATIDVKAALPYVSRGGLKLAAALDHFQIDPAGRVCLDIGASTGGFTDCLLQRGAARVHCLDTGHGQLHWKLRTDPRVLLHENTNARYLQAGDIADPISLVACDVSFISVTLILPALPPLLSPEAELVILVKPQFEVGREQVGKGGIVRDPALHQASCNRVRGVVREIGFETAIIESPILGAEGNKEFLLHGFHSDHRDHHQA